MIILSWMGTPQYAVQGAPAVEVVQELMPEEGSGIVREVGYHHLPVGVYDTREDLHSDDPEFAEILHEFEMSIKRYGEEDPDFNNAYGIMEITQNQPSLKKIHWEIHWASAEGDEDVFRRDFDRWCVELGVVRIDLNRIPVFDYQTGYHTTIG